MLGSLAKDALAFLKVGCLADLEVVSLEEHVSVEVSHPFPSEQTRCLESGLSLWKALDRLSAVCLALGDWSTPVHAFGMSLVLFPWACGLACPLSLLPPPVGNLEGRAGPGVPASTCRENTKW